MLVLSRKPGEAVNLSGGIRFTVLTVKKGGGVRIGIDAPPDCRILRDGLEGRSKGTPDAAEGFQRRDVLAAAAEVGGRAGEEELSHRNRPRVAPAA